MAEIIKMVLRIKALNLKREDGKEGGKVNGRADPDFLPIRLIYC